MNQTRRFRFAAATSLLLLAATVPIAAPGAVAHGDEESPGTCMSTTTAHLTHLCPASGSVPPSQATEIALSFTFDAPLETGWLLVLDANTTGGNLTTELVAPSGASVKQWTMTTTRAGSWMVLPETGHYVLRLSNAGDGAVRFDLVFDQSCECTAKWTQTPAAHLIFNWQVPPGKRSTIDFDVQTLDAAFTPQEGVAPGVAITATLAKRLRDDAVWPDGFEVLDQISISDDFQFNLELTEAAAYFVIVDASKPVGDDTLMLLPSVVHTTPPGRDLPGPGLAVLLLGVVAAAGVSASRQSKR